MVDRLLQAFAGRIRGLKDSSGDLAYSRDIARAHPGFSVFPSNEACLMEARRGLFAGCISATCNLNAELCGRAFHQGDASALSQAVAVRALFDGKPLVAGVKSALAHRRRDPGLARVVPPLVAWPKDEQIDLAHHLDMLREAH